MIYMINTFFIHFDVNKSSMILMSDVNDIF